MKKYANLTNASIESAGLPKDYKHAIAEYIWNGFDARARQIDIRYEKNELGYLTALRIEDDGEGIDFRTLDRSFGNFLDSMKRTTLKRSSYTRGRKGKGRFSFSLFSTRATWNTRYREGDTVFEYDIIIDRHQKESYEESYRITAPQQQTGTSVLLEGIFGLQAYALESKDFLDFLALEFGWFLLLNKDQGYQLNINGQALPYDHLILENETVRWNVTTAPDTSERFKVTFIRWKETIGDRYYYYFLNTHQEEVAKELTSFNNNGIDFHHSVFVESAFFNTFETEPLVFDEQENLFSGLRQHIVFKKLSAELRALLERKQKKYVREHVVEEMIAQIQRKQLLPKYEEKESDYLRKQQLINLLKELCISEPKLFTNMKPDYLKAYLGLIDLLLQTDKRVEVLSIIDHTLHLDETEKSNILRLLTNT
ncbi:ATP-binding protein [Sphingobacterium suaedae]|uniref:ATP-binding protein n=1 Tax=Sphingobacterium suaedae TaxID=1686402 RepID=A0ABW5KL73_9SPHI